MDKKKEMIMVSVDGSDLSLAAFEVCSMPRLAKSSTKQVEALVSFTSTATLKSTYP
jgi:hypothetical protein